METPKAKKTWQGVTGVILLIVAIITCILSFVITVPEMLFVGIILIVVAIFFIIKGSNVKDNFIVSGDKVLTYKWQDIVLKVDGYEEDEWDVNKGIAPLDVLIDYDNKRPIVCEMEDNVVHFEQCMIIYCTVNDVKRVYAVLNPIEYQTLGLDEPSIILAYIEAGDDQLYPEADKNFQKEFFSIFETKYKSYISDLEKNNAKKSGGNDLLGAAKDFGKIMGGIFSDALHLNDNSSSSNDDSDEIIVNEGAYERKLKYQYFDHDKQVYVYRDQMGFTWYSEDQQHFYKE